MDRTHAIIANIGFDLLDHAPRAGRARQTDHLNAALRANPNFAPAHYSLGLIYARQARLEDAERDGDAVSVPEQSDPLALPQQLAPTDLERALNA